MSDTCTFPSSLPVLNPYHLNCYMPLIQDMKSLFKFISLSTSYRYFANLYVYLFQQCQLCKNFAKKRSSVGLRKEDYGMVLIGLWQKIVFPSRFYG